MLPVEKIEIFHVRMPLLSAWVTAYGSDDAIESILVRMTCGDSCGWGEATPLRFPTYSPEWAAGVFLVIRDVLSPCILGREISSAQDLQAKLSFVKGNQFAKAALDLAWWDLYAKSLAQPLWKLLGGSVNKITVGADFGVMDNLDDLLVSIDQAIREGFRRIKLKYRPDWGLEMLETVRRTFPQAVFHVDCNGGFTLRDLEMFKKLDQYNLAMIEQPLAYDDLIDHAQLQAQIVTPICLDESITSPERASQAIQVKACRWINIKPGRVGGLTNALEIHNTCMEASLPCWVGSMLESALGSSFLMALATLPNIKYPCDVFPSRRLYAKDLSRPEISLSGPSQMTLSSDPGVGAAPDPEELRCLTIESAVLRV